MNPAPTTLAAGIDAQIAELAQIDSDPIGAGVTREVFTDEYSRAIEYVTALMRAAGLTVRLDAFGNLFGRLPGRNPEAPAVLTGSHFDTTLDAGRYDGVVGVLGAIEAVRRLGAEGWEPERPIEVVGFAGEEPRFGSGCIGSRAMVGTLSRDELDTMRDRHGVSIAEAMRSIGFDPDEVSGAKIDPEGIHAFVELHVEQGSVLEAAGVPVGVVTHIAAPHDLLVTVRGAAAHAGATPMRLRQDALAGAAEIMVELERGAIASISGSTVATVGVAAVRPGAINVIPGEVELQVDIRDHDLAARTAVVDSFLEAVESIAARRGLEFDVATITRDDPAACSPLVTAATRSACADLGIACMDIVSGAYHDAMVLGAAVPIGMIFVPSRDGISHSPLEYTSPAEIEHGVRVLAQTLRTLTRPS